MKLKVLRYRHVGIKRAASDGFPWRRLAACEFARVSLGSACLLALCLGGFHGSAAGQTLEDLQMVEELGDANVSLAPTGYEYETMLDQNAADFFTGMLGEDAYDLMSGFLTEQRVTYRWEDQPIFLKGLASENKEVRDTAMDALVYFGESVVKDVVEILRSPDPVASQAAGQVLVRLGYRGREALPALVHTLEHHDWIMRRFACQAIGKMQTPDYVWMWSDGEVAFEGGEPHERRPYNWPAVPGLQQLLNDSEPMVRQAAVEALREVGKEARELEYSDFDAAGFLQPMAPLLEDDDPEVCHQVALTIAAFREQAGPVMDALTGLLTNPEPLARETAAQALGEVAENSPEITRELTPLLEDAEDEVRAAALQALPSVMRKDRELIDRMMKCLVDPSPKVRAAAADALGRLGPRGAQARELVGRLAALLQRDPSGEVRAAAAASIGKLYLHARGMEEVLDRAMNDPEPAVRGEAAYARVLLGDSDRKLLLKVLQLRMSPSPVEREGSVRALGELAKTDKNARISLLNNLSQIGYSEEELGWIMDALAGIGPSILPDMIDRVERSPELAYFYTDIFMAMGAEAVPELAELTKHHNRDVRMGVAFALGRMGEVAEPAIASLVGMTNSTNFYDVAAGTAALVAIGKPAETALIRLAKSPNKRARITGLGAMVAMNVPPEEIIPAATEALQSEDPMLRAAGVNTLALLGPDAKPAIPALCKRMADPDPAVRVFVPGALVKIDDTSPEVAVALGKALFTKDKWGTRRSAAEGLQQMGEAAAPAAQSVVAVFPKASASLKRDLITVMANIGWEARDGLPYLVEIVRSSDHMPLLTASTRGIARIASGYREHESEVAYEAMRDAFVSLTAAYNLIRENPKLRRLTRRDQSRLEEDLKALMSITSRKFAMLPLHTRAAYHWRGSAFAPYTKHFIFGGVILLLVGLAWGAKFYMAYRANRLLAA